MALTTLGTSVSQWGGTLVSRGPHQRRWPSDGTRSSSKRLSWWETSAGTPTMTLRAPGATWRSLETSQWTTVTWTCVVQYKPTIHDYTSSHPASHLSLFTCVSQRIHWLVGRRRMIGQASELSWVLRKHSSSTPVPLVKERVVSDLIMGSGQLVALAKLKLVHSLDNAQLVYIKIKWLN